MTTLQARTWAQFADRKAMPRDKRRFRMSGRDALGLALLLALLLAGIALRVFMFVNLA